MRTQATFDAWLTCALETLRLTRAGDHAAARQYDDDRQRLWDACLADGWTLADGERALRPYAQAREVGR